MRITPKGRVDIDFSLEEIEAIEEAYKVFDIIYNQMREFGYEYLYSEEDDECQVRFARVDIEKVRNFIKEFNEYLPIEAE